MAKIQDSRPHDIEARTFQIANTLVFVIKIVAKDHYEKTILANNNFLSYSRFGYCKLEFI